MRHGKHDTGSFVKKKSLVKSVMKKKTACSGKNFKQQVEYWTRRSRKTFIFSDEVWSKLSRNVNSQITDVEVQKTFMQFMEFLCMTLV